MISIDVGEQNMRARHAIILYGKDRGEAVFASVHSVSEDEKGSIKIEAGQPATTSGLRSLFSALDPARSEKPILFDGKILSRGPHWMVWWAKPQSRRVWFKADKIGTRNAVTPHPALVFAVSPIGWQIFAIKGNRRPGAKTPLYQAPYFNVWDSGAICVGSAARPKGPNAGTPELWEKAFFESVFAHPNVHQPMKLVLHKKGPADFWKTLLDGKHQTFPNEVLVKTGRTIESLLADIGRKL